MVEDPLTGLPIRTFRLVIRHLRVQAYSLCPIEAVVAYVWRHEFGWDRPLPLVPQVCGQVLHLSRTKVDQIINAADQSPHGYNRKLRADLLKACGIQ